MNWKQREKARERNEATKAKLTSSANEAIGLLWRQSTIVDAGFSNEERKAISDAMYSINSIIGGWARKRR
jgi:hypothetical protein